MTSLPDAPDGARTAQVITALESVLAADLAGAGPGTRLFEELGLDSSKVLELLLTLEEEHGIEIDIERLQPERLATIGAVSALIAESAGAGE